MEKVKLPKKVAVAIEWQRKSVSPTNYDIIKYAITGGGNLEIRDFAEDNFDELLEALVNGYEVQQTPEDKVREYYEKQYTMRNDYEKPAQDQSYIAIETVLELLGIKISGVNA